MNYDRTSINYRSEWVPKVSGGVVREGIAFVVGDLLPWRRFCR